jgi:alginate O-acetyltransferase complex protein AlgI
MIFSSIQYLIFLPIVAVLYWRTSGATRLWLVVLASYFFYMSWLPVYGTLLLLMTTLNWALGLWMENVRAKSPQMLKPLLWLGLFGNLGCLCYYKYADFFLTNLIHGFNSFSGWMQVPAPFPEWSPMGILLPLGISFFVFEFVHYIVDVYRGDKPVKSWLEFMAFAAFFPSQIAGPIKRYQDFMDGLRTPLPWSQRLLSEGGALIAQGMFKKVAIADPIGGIIYTSFASQSALSCPDAWIASIGFVIQVYCDFSGYTDIGRGSALLLGIRLPENFTLPYLAHDLADFWRRWHMSLSFWLRDYVYIPLGGSKRDAFKNGFNLFTTMVACGLWHGAAWHYVLFGVLQGFGLIVHREWRLFLKKIDPKGTVSNTAAAKWFGTFLTMLFITATYTIFRAPDVPIGLHVLGSWFSSNFECTLILPVIKSGVLWLLAIYAGFWLITEAIKRYKPQPEGTWGVYPSMVRYASWTAALFLIVAARPTVATPFVYFQF